MIEKGWCPFTTRMVSESVCGLGYASTCKPYVRESSEGPDRCIESCVVNKIDASTYAIQHITSTCSCSYSEPALEHIVNVLLVGKIPVVHSILPNGELSSCDSSQTAYMAISHVWADGLGSTTQKGLPTCQIKRLATITGQLVSGGAFWIDSLCVPEGDTKNGDKINETNVQRRS